MVKRIEWIDVAKGIGIYLVVLGHFPLATEFSKYFYIFHMPLFFFLSGIVFKKDKFSSFFAFAKNRARTLLIPYFIFSFATYLFWLFIGRHFGDDSGLSISAVKPLMGTFYSVGQGGWLEHNVPLWFLTCLFAVESIFYFMSKIKNKLFFHLLIFVGSVLGFLLGELFKIQIFWSLDIALVALAFYSLGNLSKNKIGVLLEKKSNFVALLVGIFLIILLANLNGYVDMNGRTYNNYIYYFLGAIVGIYTCLSLAKYLEGVKFLSYLGKNSLIILALHNISLSIIKAIIVFGLGLSLDSVSKYWFTPIIVAFSAILLLIPVIFFINKYIPFILGKGITKKIKRKSNVKPSLTK